MGESGGALDSSSCIAEKYLTLLCFLPRVILAQEVSPDLAVQLVNQALRYSTVSLCLRAAAASPAPPHFSLML